MMTEKRFFKKEYPYDWWFVFDREQEYMEDMKIPFETDYGNLIAMSEDQVIDELNTLHNENQSQKQIIDNLLDDLNKANRRNVDYKKRIDYLEEENQYLKQSNKDARHILEKEFDFASEQRQKHLDDPVVANAYDIIRFDIRKALDKLSDSE